MSSGMFWASPESTEPTRKIRIAVWKMRLRPKRSLIFPHRGNDTVDVRM